MEKTILSLKNVSYSYHTLFGETKAISDLSFSVREGEFLAIVGPSGCGKSTLLSIIAGLLDAEEGTVSYHGDTIGYMLQKDHLFDWLTIYENITLGLKLHHIRDSSYIENIQKLLQSYELQDFADKHPSELSGGMRQRAALIRTLALNPQLVLLDEPFSALDYQTRISVSYDICERIREAHKTVILITHDLSEAISLSDRILVLTKRPSTICLEMPVPEFSKGHSAIKASEDPKYHELFNTLWEALQYENK